ncbi:MAG TPA: lipid A-modifier LpxR family protein, partial [Thermoanaerobaculia bacterium]|nr:lipid A-modifier LpxR family protein [Thermoanaerobaculia bacterium]
MRKTFIAAAITIALASITDAKVFDLFNSQTIYWENDNFGIGRKSDRFYTNGVKVTMGLTPSEWPSLSARAQTFRIDFCKKTPLCSPNQPVESLSVVFGQNFYTPQDITIPTPQPNDRPWAGWLYTGLALAIVDAPQKVQNTFEVQLGILGPGAGAGATQTYIHKDLGFSNHIPAGWHNQLKNEPTLNVIYKHARRYGNNTRDIVPEGGVALGTVQT